MALEKFALVSFILKFEITFSKQIFNNFLIIDDNYIHALR